MDTKSTLKQWEAISVLPLAPGQLWQYWETLQPMVQRALDHANGELHTDDVYIRIQERLMQLLVVVAQDRIIGTLVTEVVDYPRKRKLRVVLCAGEGLDSWVDEAQRRLDEGARAVGATEIEWSGRRGWMRYFKDRPGFKESYLVMTKEVSP